MSRSISTSPAATTAASQPNATDNLVESLIDFSDYDALPYQSPSLSPVAGNKVAFVKPMRSETAQTSLLSTSQPMSGPSHQYDLYKQQTGMVPGALASTHAVNQNNSQIQGYSNFSLDYLSGIGNDDVFDFNAAPSHGSMNPSEMDMSLDSPPPEHSFFFGDSTISSTVNPSSLATAEPSAVTSPPVVSGQTGNVGRLWPGMHQQAAMAKAQAQQAQQRQQQMIQQQQQQQQQRQRSQAKQPQRSKGTPPTDPIVEQKITQLLNTMRNRSSQGDSADSTPTLAVSRPKKDEDDMDEDERLLASEEGKKLSSKERRQLRNKVSARAFRSRRKEYITQLEAEIANKVTENGDLRSQNRSLIEENKRLSDLTRMLLSSPPFSEFLDHLSANPQNPPQPQSQPQPESRRIPKDVNPYNAQQQQQVDTAILPDQPVDFSGLNLDSQDSFGFQPQVYSVLETPEPAAIDTSALSGKTSNFVGGHFDADEEKVEMPVIEKAPASVCGSPIDTEECAATESSTPAPAHDEEFENDPAFALYHHSTSAAYEDVKEPVELDTGGFSNVDIFGGIEPDKALARYELVDAEEEEEVATFAMARVQRISVSLDAVMSRLELLTVDL